MAKFLTIVIMILGGLALVVGIGPILELLFVLVQTVGIVFLIALIGGGILSLIFGAIYGIILLIMYIFKS